MPSLPPHLVLLLLLLLRHVPHQQLQQSSHRGVHRCAPDSQESTPVIEVLVVTAATAVLEVETALRVHLSAAHAAAQRLSNTL